MSHQHLCLRGHHGCVGEGVAGGATSRGVCTRGSSGFAFQHWLLPGALVPAQSWGRIQPRVPRLRGLGSTGMWEAEGGVYCSPGLGFVSSPRKRQRRGCISASGRGVMEGLPDSPLGSGCRCKVTGCSLGK